MFFAEILLLLLIINYYYYYIACIYMAFIKYVCKFSKLLYIKKKKQNEGFFIFKTLKSYKKKI